MREPRAALGFFVRFVTISAASKRPKVYGRSLGVRGKDRASVSESPRGRDGPVSVGTREDLAER